MASNVKFFLALPLQHTPGPSHQQHSLAPSREHSSPQPPPHQPHQPPPHQPHQPPPPQPHQPPPHQPHQPPPPQPHQPPPHQPHQPPPHQLPLPSGLTTRTSCPVCRGDYQNLGKHMQEKHVSFCTLFSSPQVFILVISGNIRRLFFPIPNSRARRAQPMTVTFMRQVVVLYQSIKRRITLSSQDKEGYKGYNKQEAFATCVLVFVLVENYVTLHSRPFLFRL